MLALELVKERAQQQVEWQLQGDLLSELLDAAAPLAPSLVARARRHGVDLARAHRIVVVRCSSSSPTTCWRSCAARPDAALVHRDAALVCLRGEDVVLAARDAEPVVRSVTAAADAAASRWRSASATLRRPRDRAIEQAAACARLALTGAAASSAPSGSGRCGSCSTRPTSRRSARSSPSNSGRCSSPTRGAPTCSRTLRAFVAADGNVAETAKACFVHKNTLRYRLKRLTDVLGRDPAEPDAKFHLRMAFDLVDLFAGMGIDLLRHAPGSAERLDALDARRRDHVHVHVHVQWRGVDPASPALAHICVLRLDDRASNGRRGSGARSGKPWCTVARSPLSAGPGCSAARTESNGRRHDAECAACRRFRQQCHCGRTRKSRHARGPPRR